MPIKPDKQGVKFWMAALVITHYARWLKQLLKISFIGSSNSQILDQRTEFCANDRLSFDIHSNPLGSHHHVSPRRSCFQIIKPNHVLIADHERMTEMHARSVSRIYL